jgi:hypothetical protein
MATERVRLLRDGEELVEVVMHPPMTLTAEESLSLRAALLGSTILRTGARPAPRPAPRA